MDRLDLETLTELLDERLAGVSLTPGERAEALCIALGVDCALSAAVRGVSTETVRASRRRLRRKLQRVGATPAPREPAGIRAAGPARARFEHG